MSTASLSSLPTRTDNALPSLPQTPEQTAQLWATASAEAKAFCEGCSDSIANMANVAAILWQSLADINWVGFYRFDGQQLVLGPFQGKPACIYIPLSRGVCGTAAQSLTSQRVADVHACENHIACDVNSRSELVVPILRPVTADSLADSTSTAEGDSAMDMARLIGVLDIDSPHIGRFSIADQTGAEALVKQIAPYL